MFINRYFEQKKQKEKTGGGGGMRNILFRLDKDGCR
jgi:hypothetical protein